MKLDNTLVEVFRTGECAEGYTTAVTISYFLNTAYIHGFSGQPTLACFRELKAYLKARGVAKAVIAKKDAEGNFREVVFGGASDK